MHQRDDEMPGVGRREDRIGTSVLQLCTRALLLPSSVCKLKFPLLEADCSRSTLVPKGSAFLLSSALTLHRLSPLQLTAANAKSNLSLIISPNSPHKSA